MAEISGVLRAEFETLVRETKKGDAPDGYVLRQIFDPYKKLQKFIIKNPELIPEGLEVLKQSDDQEHLSLIKDVMLKKPESVSDGLDALIDNGSDNAFQIFKSFAEENPKHIPLALSRLTDFLKTYDFKIEGKDGNQNTLGHGKGFKTIQLQTMGQTFLDDPKKYGFHPVELLAFHVECAKVRNEPAFKGRHQSFTDKILRTVVQEKDLLKDMPTESMKNLQDSLKLLAVMGCVTSLGLKNFDEELEKKTGKAFGFEWEQLIREQKEAEIALLAAKVEVSPDVRAHHSDSPDRPESPNIH